MVRSRDMPLSSAAPAPTMMVRSCDMLLSSAAPVPTTMVRSCDTPFSSTAPASMVRSRDIPSSSTVPARLPSLHLNNAPAEESLTVCTPSLDPSGSPTRSLFLRERNSALLRMKQACIDSDNVVLTSPEVGCMDGDQRVVKLINPKRVSDPASDSRIVLVAERSRSPSPVPPMTASSPDSLRHCAESNCLKILCETFCTAPVVPPAPQPCLPSTSSVPRPSCGTTVTTMVAMRMSCEAAPPVDPSKRRNISQPSGATCGNHSTSQALVNMLRKFRPCPQSESDEDSCFDPRTPSPPSSTNSADEDCAVDIVNLECAQPLAYRTPAVPLPSQTNLNLHDDDDDDAIPSAQPCPDPPLMFLRTHLLCQVTLCQPNLRSMILMIHLRTC